MTIADKYSPLFNEDYRKKLREEKKSPLRPMSAKEIRESFGRKKERVRAKVSPYVRVSDLNHSSEDPSIEPKLAIEVGIKIKF